MHAVGEALDDSCDVDRVNVPLLQLVEQPVHMWHDTVLTARLWKFHLVPEVPGSLCDTT